MVHHRNGFHSFCFVFVIVLIFNLAAVGQQQRSSTPAVKPKELNLRYTHETRTEMANMPMKMPSQRATIYIKGKRQRQEDESRQLVTIDQCDLQRYVYLNLRDQSCLVKPFVEGEEDQEPEPYQPSEPPPPQPKTKPRKGGIVVVEVEVTDTGERKDFFGLKARHILARYAYDAQPDSCNPGQMEMTSDVWLVDLPRWTCRVKVDQPYKPPMPMRRYRPDCMDTYQTKMKGNQSLLNGFEIYRKQTMNVQGQPVTIIYEVTDLSLAELDASLFEKPADCREKDEQAFWKGVRSDDQFSMWGAMKGADKMTAGDMSDEPATMKPKRAGVLRIGVAAKNSSDAQLDVSALRREMVETIRSRGGDTLDVVSLMTTDQSGLQPEAESKQVDYILFVDVKEAKADTGRKIGGFLGRAAGVDVKEKVSAKLDYQWIDRAKMQTLSTRSMKDSVSGSVPEAMEQFCRTSAQQAYDEFGKIRKK